MLAGAMIEGDRITVNELIGAAIVIGAVWVGALSNKPMAVAEPRIV
jgi:drug/metabolite transporter (DMT)-like permease